MENFFIVAIAGAVIGAVITKIVEAIWNKCNSLILERRKPKITGAGFIGGIDKK